MERPWYRSFDWLLAFAALAASAVGVVLIQSADLSTSDPLGEWRRQIIYIVLGAAVMAFFAWFDYHKWQRWARQLYVANLVLLVLVMKGGHSALGAQRWISLGPLGTFQPSEPAKLILAIVVAAMLARKVRIGPREVVEILVAVSVPALLILKQPDLGTTLVIFAILSVELFFGVSNFVDFALYGAGTAAVGAFVVGSDKILKPFQKNRLLVFLNPNADPQGAGWNLNQSKIAVGSGELLGKGLHQGTQTQLNFVPEHSRDFIFTVMGEEFGFVGSIATLAIFATLFACAMRSVLAARDRFGLFLAVGLVAMFAFHVTVNVGMTIGIMPITGIPLPFMSYGGSSVLTDFAAVGLLLNISLQRDKLVF